MNNIGEAFSARETAAVVGVLRDSNVVTVSGDREALAQAILSAVKAVRYSGLRVSALMSDGSPVNVVIIDKGDATPGFDAEVRKQDLLVRFVDCEANGGRYQDAPLVYPKALAARARRGYWLGEPDPPGRYRDVCEPFTFSHFAAGETWATRTGGNRA